MVAREFLSIQEFCGLFGKDYSFWNTLKKDGNLPKTVKLRSRTYVPVASANEFISSLNSHDENAETAEYYAKEAVTSQELGDFVRAADCWDLSIRHSRNSSDVHRRLKWFRRCVEASAVSKDTVDFIRSVTK